MNMRADPWHNRSTISKWAHVLERSGLALAGGSCGLFVAAEVGRANIDLFASDTSVFAMMVLGTIGFYLGIDLPPAPPHHAQLPLRTRIAPSTDTVELLSATGTFLTAAAAVWAVSVIILDETTTPAGAYLTGITWGVGAVMQVAAGTIARMRAEGTLAN
jgi:hypothetical protein